MGSNPDYLLKYFLLYHKILDEMICKWLLTELSGTLEALGLT